MSALTTALNPLAQAPVQHQPPSPTPSSSSLAVAAPSLSNSVGSSSSSSLYDEPAQQPMTNLDRPNEHLAVLLPKHLWKPDSVATVCDNFYCRVSFGLFERRHHCRKCGGVFCAACTSRTTPLLDTTNLPFVHPPRNHRLTEFESPTAPILNSRVCDDCWDQVHGIPTSPHTPPKPATSIFFKYPRASSSSSSASSSGSDSSLNSLAHSPAPRRRRRRTTSLQHSSSSSSLTTDSSTRSAPAPSKVLRTAMPLPLECERSYGELDAYPLKRSSVLCKATGGGRWQPKQSPVLDGYRPPIPGAKAPFELEMERLEREERLKKESPIIMDGDFRYRLTSRNSIKNAPALLLSRSTF